jgi:hypothetical protein
MAAAGFGRIIGGAAGMKPETAMTDRMRQLRGKGR